LLGLGPYISIFPAVCYFFTHNIWLQTFIAFFFY